MACRPRRFGHSGRATKSPVTESYFHRRGESFEARDIAAGPWSPDMLHGRLLGAIEDLFNTHKAALGWGHKRIRFE